MTEPGGGAPAPEQPGGWQQPQPQPSGTGGFQTAAVEPGPAPGVTYADLTTRIIAYIIDAVILAVVIAIVGVALVVPLFIGAGLVGGLIAATILTVIVLIGSAAYFVYTWTTMRASPGQKVLNLETVNAADGATLTRDQAIRRWAYLYGPAAVGQVVSIALGDLGILANLISLALLAYSIYLLYTASQSSKRQGFHDIQAATVVVKRSVA